MLDRICDRAWIGLLMTPPCPPECTSVRGPKTSIWIAASPRQPIVTEGISLEYIPPSTDKTKLQPRRSLCDSSKDFKVGLPISSSPSNKNLRFTGSVFSLMLSSAAIIAGKTPPLSSAEPRAKTFPSSTLPSKGGESHSSKGSAG